MNGSTENNAPRRNIKLVVAYNGAAYHGWQRQADGVDTVQQRIEAAAVRVVKHPVAVHGAGRTDAGVHAAGQVANFHTTNLRVPLLGLRRAMNARLPADILIRSAEEVADDFHASLSAVGKTYRYRIRVAPQREVMLAGQVWQYPRHSLDTEKMCQAASGLLGEHDFAGFATSGDDRATTVRTIFRCDVAEADNGREIHITVRGDGFLYNMVRNIVGTLTEIGRGHWPADRIGIILATADRRHAGPTAPAAGLTMLRVHYRT
jgi:tRNA pseudouridine38-40 synthase